MTLATGLSIGEPMMKRGSATLATLLIAFFLVSGCTQKPSQESARDKEAPVQDQRAEAERTPEATPAPPAPEAEPLPGQTPGKPAAQPTNGQRPGARPAPAKPGTGTARTGKEPVPAPVAPAPTPTPVTEPAKPAPTVEAKPAPTVEAKPAPASQEPARKPAAPASKSAVAPDVVILKGAPLGGVRLEHKLHVKYAGNDCATCHHASRPQQPASAPHQACSDCHTKVATAPMKTTYQAAFHNPAAKSGTCVTCHIAENAKGKKAPVKCVDCHKKDNK